MKRHRLAAHGLERWSYKGRALHQNEDMIDDRVTISYESTSDQISFLLLVHIFSSSILFSSIWSLFTVV